MKQYTSEELGQKFRFMPLLLFLRAIGSLALARILAYAYCRLPALVPIVQGLAAFWILLAILTALSAYSNVQSGKPAIGAGEGRMIAILLSVAIVAAIGFDMETGRGMQCTK